MVDDQRLRDRLSIPSHYWHSQSSFQKFQKFAKILIVVNGHSERALGMMQQLVHRYEKEDEEQNRLLTADKIRSNFRVPGGRSKITKKKLSEKLMSLNILKKQK